MPANYDNVMSPTINMDLSPTINIDLSPTINIDPSLEVETPSIQPGTYERQSITAFGVTVVGYGIGLSYTPSMEQANMFGIYSPTGYIEVTVNGVTTGYSTRDGSALTATIDLGTGTVTVETSKLY